MLTQSTRGGAAEAMLEDLQRLRYISSPSNRDLYDIQILRVFVVVQGQRS